MNDSQRDGTHELLSRRAESPECALDTLRRIQSILNDMPPLFTGEGNIKTFRTFASDMRDAISILEAPQAGAHNVGDQPEAPSSTPGVPSDDERWKREPHLTLAGLEATMTWRMQPDDIDRVYRENAWTTCGVTDISVRRAIEAAVRMGIVVPAHRALTGTTEDNR